MFFSKLLKVLIVSSNNESLESYHNLYSFFEIKTFSWTLSIKSLASTKVFSISLKFNGSTNCFTLSIHLKKPVQLLNLINVFKIVKLVSLDCL